MARAPGPAPVTVDEVSTRRPSQPPTGALSLVSCITGAAYRLEGSVRTVGVFDGHLAFWVLDPGRGVLTRLRHAQARGGVWPVQLLGYVPAHVPVPGLDPGPVRPGRGQPRRSLSDWLAARARPA